MIPWLCRNFAYAPMYALRGEPVFSLMKDVRAFNAQSRDAIRTRQTEQVTQLLRFAKAHNPYYRDLYESSGTDLAGVKTLDDLRQVPLLTKEMLIANAENMLSQGKWRLSPRYTSGSTGRPLRLYKDRHATACMDAVMHEAYEWHNVRVGDRQGRIWRLPLPGMERFYWLAKDRLFNRRRLNAYALTVERCVTFYRSLERFRPTFMYGYPNATYEFANTLLTAGIDASRLGLACVITTGEVLFETQRERIRQAFGCPVVNEYGCTETGIMAFECRSGSMHLVCFNLLVEIVNPETGRPVNHGEIGDVVVTELASRALPLIRYRVGDRAQHRTDECPCGNHLPLIGRIQGRLADMIMTPDGRRIDASILDYLLACGVARFQATQPANDRLIIKVERDFHAGSIDLNRAKDKWRPLFGPDLSVEFTEVDKIQADPSGKIRVFISKIHGSPEE